MSFHYTDNRINLQNLYFSIRQINETKKGDENVAGNWEMSTKFYSENLKE